MKRRVLAGICTILMAISISACGDTDTANTNEPVQTEAVSEAEATPEVVDSAEEESVEEADVTPSEEKTKEEIEEPEEIADAEPSVQEEKEPVASNADDEVEESVEDTKPEPSQDTIVTEPIPADEAQNFITDVPETAVIEPLPVADVNSSISTMSVNGVWDVDDFVLNISNVYDYYMVKEQIMLVYGDWFVEISTNAQTFSPGNAYISIGKWDYYAKAWNNNTFSCVFSFGAGSTLSNEKYPGFSQYAVSNQALEILPTLVEYMRAHPQTDVAPAIPGYTFKPCQSDNPFVQY